MTRLRGGALIVLLTGCIVRGPVEPIVPVLPALTTGNAASAPPERQAPAASDNQQADPASARSDLAPGAGTPLAHPVAGGAAGAPLASPSAAPSPSATPSPSAPTPAPTVETPPPSPTPGPDAP